MLKTETNHQPKIILSEGQARLSEILDGKGRKVVEVDHQASVALAVERMCFHKVGAVVVVMHLLPAARGDGLSDGATLRAEGQAVARVLDVTANVDPTIAAQQRRADAEARGRGVGPLGDVARALLEVGEGGGVHLAEGR